MKKLLLTALLVAISVNLTAFTMNNNVAQDYQAPHGKQIKDNITYIRNRSGQVMNQMDVVAYMNSNTHHKEVKLASNDDRCALKAYGVVLNTRISDGGKGRCQTSGIVRGIDTSKYALNDELFLGLDGRVINVKPLSGFTISLGYVVKVDKNDGWILLNILKL